MNSFKQNSTPILNNSTPMMQFRKLKILTKYRTRKYDETKIPEIRLEGKWLEALGFKQGQTVKIKQQKNKLTITVVNEQKPVRHAAAGLRF